VGRFWATLWCDFVLVAVDDNNCVLCLRIGSGIVLLPWIESRQLLLLTKRCTHLQQTLWFSPGNYFSFCFSSFFIFCINILYYQRHCWMRHFCHEITWEITDIWHGRWILCKVLWRCYSLIAFYSACVFCSASDCESVHITVGVSETWFYWSGFTKPVQCEALADVWSLASLCCMFHISNSGQQLNVLLLVLVIMLLLTGLQEKYE